MLVQHAMYADTMYTCYILEDAAHISYTYIHSCIYTSNLQHQQFTFSKPKQIENYVSWKQKMSHFPALLPLRLRLQPRLFILLVFSSSAAFFLYSWLFGIFIYSSLVMGKYSHSEAAGNPNRAQAQHAAIPFNSAPEYVAVRYWTEQKNSQFSRVSLQHSIAILSFNLTTSNGYIIRGCKAKSTPAKSHEIRWHRLPWLSFTISLRLDLIWHSIVRRSHITIAKQLGTAIE